MTLSGGFQYLEDVVVTEATVYLATHAKNTEYMTMLNLLYPQDKYGNKQQQRKI